MALTTDPSDPRLGHGVDAQPVEQHEAYLVLSEEERARGWQRPFRDTYRHVGAPGPKYPLRPLTAEEQERYRQAGYEWYEEYPADSGALGAYWTAARLENAGKGCGYATTMGRELAETYAAQPHFYGATYCVGCRRHLPVNEFVWAGTSERVGS